MTALLWMHTAGELVRVRAGRRFRSMVLESGVPDEPSDDYDLAVTVEQDRQPFDVTGWEMMDRSTWTSGDKAVVRNVCSSGFDMLVTNGEGHQPAFTFRWRPPRRERVASRLLPSRARLLSRAVLIQYPAMWRGVLRGRAPVHAPACTAGGRTVLLTGPAGVGKSTLIAREVEAGGHAVSDNLAVTDGRSVWGVVEPTRSDNGSGRRMPHGRREMPLPGRVPVLRPDHLVVLRRGTERSPRTRPCDPEEAARLLIASTYIAGELRRFWSFAAAMAEATGLGPPHPPVAERARDLAHSLVCVEGTLPSDRIGIQELFAHQELTPA